VDIQHLDFQKQAGHFLDHLVFRTALFDPHQRYVTGNERNLDLDLDENRLASLERSGIIATTQLAVPPGDYFLREVVEEKSTRKLSTLTQTIKVP
jgi:hypothetical protein